MFRIKIADIVIEIDNRYGDVEKISKDYLTDDKPFFTVSVSDAEIEAEANRLDESFTAAELESIGIYRKIAERIADYGAFVFHGAVVVMDGNAYLFTAKSGVGKTTHIRLWLKCFKGRARILNGDKPVIRIIDGKAYIAGTPWRGKEQYGEAGFMPLSGIAFLERDKENTAYTEMAANALERFVTQAYLPKKNAALSIKVLKLLDTVINTTPLITLRCNMEDDAAYVAYDAFKKAKG